LVPGRARDFSILVMCQTGFGADPASYSVGKAGAFPTDKVTWA